MDIKHQEQVIGRVAFGPSRGEKGKAGHWDLTGLSPEHVQRLAERPLIVAVPGRAADVPAILIQTRGLLLTMLAESSDPECHGQIQGMIDRITAALGR